MSFFEIYGGKVSDLLNGKKKLVIQEDANSKIEAINFSFDDLETIKSNIIEGTNPYKVISEEELLKHLKERQEHYSRTNGFIGLTSFVKNYLGLLGYDYSASFDVITQLEQQNKVEIYYVDGLKGNQVAAIKLDDSISSSNSELQLMILIQRVPQSLLLGFKCVKTWDKKCLGKFTYLLFVKSLFSI